MQTMYGGPERSKELQPKEIPANRKMLKKHTKDNTTVVEKHTQTLKKKPKSVIGDVCNQTPEEVATI